MKTALNIIIGAALFCLFMIIYLAQARAQQAAMLTVPCGDTKAMIDRIKQKYHEQTVGGGLTKGGDLVRIFVSDRHTFTIVRSNPNGMSCMISSGTDWEDIKPETKGTKS